MIATAIKKLTEAYEKGLMTKEEYLEELEAMIKEEWKAMESDPR